MFCWARVMFWFGLRVDGFGLLDFRGKGFGIWAVWLLGLVSVGLQ